MRQNEITAIAIEREREREKHVEADRLIRRKGVWGVC